MLAACSEERDDELSYLAVIAVNHERIMLLVEDDTQDLLHRANGNAFLLGTLHVDDVVPNRMSSHEVDVWLIRLVLATESAGRSQPRVQPG